jgi:protein-tyrosine phosphatase
MIARPEAIVGPMLGLLLGVGCGGPSPRVLPDGANQDERNVSWVDVSATDGESTRPADGARSPHSDIDSAPCDSESGPILDSPPEGDGRDATSASADVQADVPARDVSWPVDSSLDDATRDDDAELSRDSPSAVDGDEVAVQSTDEDADALSVDGEPSCGWSPWILVGAVPNARQLGGIPLVGGGAVACDRIYRGSSLASLASERCDQFASMGIKTVIDLRSVGEQTSGLADCVIQQSNFVSAPLPIPYSLSPDDYLAILYTAPSMRTVFAVLADTTAYPVYYYCLYGRDRTGVLTAVILSALGASRQTIEDEYALTREAGFSYAPASLDAVLDEIDRIGGIDAYFRAVGVPDEHVQAVRAILTRPPPSQRS